jgi:hypothetical protein
MPAKRSKPTSKRAEAASKLRLDVSETAFRVVQEATQNTERTLPPRERTTRNAVAVERGAKGGSIGGKARAAKLTPDQREAAAQTAALARWKKN